MARLTGLLAAAAIVGLTGASVSAQTLGRAAGGVHARRCQQSR